MRHVVYTIFSVKKWRVMNAWAYPGLSSQGMMLPTVDSHSHLIKLLPHMLAWRHVSRVILGLIKLLSEINPNSSLHKVRS